ncbi:MAG: CRTAC1 family protein [Gemmatimonadota bacterium]
MNQKTRTILTLGLLIGGATAGCTPDPTLDPTPEVNRFEPVTTGHAVEYQGTSRGAAWGDFDGDGDPDLFVSHPTGDDAPQSNVLYRNDAGRLTLIESAVDQAPPGAWQGGVWVDVEGDGDLDLHIVGRDGSGSLFFENEGGVLAAVTNDPFGGSVWGASMTCWADADGDGLLDAFVVGSGEGRNQLFRNRGAWSMEEVPLSELATGGGASRACVWIDVDGDRLPEMVLANARQPNTLLRNRGDLAFEADLDSPLTTDEAYGYGLSAADVNGDGYQDVFVANFDAPNTLLLGGPDGVLTPSPLGERLQSPASKGHVWGDFDLDGVLDLYLGSGTPRPGMLNRLWSGTGGGDFALDTVSGFTLDADTSAAVAGADVDMDGDIDLFVANWGSPGSLDRLYENRAQGAHWLQIDLEGEVSNSMGVGARVSTKTSGTDGWMHRWLTLSTGYAGQNEPRIHFGLGTAGQVDSLVVRWPSGLVTTMTDVPADQLVRIREGSGG